MARMPVEKETVTPKAINVSILGDRWPRDRNPIRSVGPPTKTSGKAARITMTAWKINGVGHMRPKNISGIIHAIMGSAKNQANVIRRAASFTCFSSRSTTPLSAARPNEEISRTSNPAARIAAASFDSSISESASTLARPRERLTAADWTPLTPSNARSTEATQPAHVMPSTPICSDWLGCAASAAKPASFTACASNSNVADPSCVTDAFSPNRLTDAS